MISNVMMPAMRKEMIAAGPAPPMTTPLPTNRPAPITPPRAIRFMCRRFRPFPRPELSVCSGTVLSTFPPEGVDRARRLPAAARRRTVVQGGHRVGVIHITHLVSHLTLRLGNSARPEPDL